MWQMVSDACVCVCEGSNEKMPIKAIASWRALELWKSSACKPVVLYDCIPSVLFV
jgi:hypothetical protein